jgi:cardiolipin synthase
MSITLEPDRECDERSRVNGDFSRIAGTIRDLRRASVSYGDADVQALDGATAIHHAMLDAIHRARASIDLSTFNLGGDVGDEFLGAIAQQARQGVKVRVLADALGARRVRPEGVAELLRAGGEFHSFRPLRRGSLLRRGHRKILVCDGRRGFLGGVGLDDRWRAEPRSRVARRDLHVSVQGAICRELTTAFEENWFERTSVKRSGVLSESVEHHASTQSQASRITRSGRVAGWEAFPEALHALLATARRSVQISTAYFVPDTRTLELICAAARRGVSVDLICNGGLGGSGDKQFTQETSVALFGKLWKSGGRTWVYRSSMLHSKLLIVDGQATLVGSSNLNRRSFQWDEELDIVSIDTGLARQLSTQFENDLSRSELRLPPNRFAQLLRNVVVAGPGRVMRPLL